MKGINFEEWKALVKKNRQALNTKSNIYRSEPESLTWGGPGANKADEYLQMHTITYNVTGMEVPSDWPTEIMSTKTLSLSIPAAPYGASQTVAANVDYTYTNDVLKINNVQNDITVTVNVGEVLYENAKVGDYLYSDWTFGPTKKSGYIGRCIATSQESQIGKTIWCSQISEQYKSYVWSTETVDTNLSNFSTQDAAKTDMDGKENTQYLLSLGADKYPAAAYAAQQFDGFGYLPAMGELSKYMLDPMPRRLFYAQRDGVSGSINSNIQSSTESGTYYNWIGGCNYSWSPVQEGKNDTGNGGRSVIAFCQLSGKPGKPINTNGHEYVDLGLPSGTLWATMNVGAASETDGGLYFQWGDTQGYTTDQVGNSEGQKAFSWADYKWTEDNGSTMSKYNATDGKTILDLEDDAVRENWSGDWKMPTEEQFQELLNTDNCTNVWTTVDGVNGRLFTSVSNGNTLFIPAAGAAYSGSVSSVGDYACVWSNSFNSSIVKAGRGLHLYSDSIFVSNRNRYYGQSVRGVIG